jgi:hypothetical protein
VNGEQSFSLGTWQQAKGPSVCPEGLLRYPSFSGQMRGRSKPPPSQPSITVAFLV